MSPTDLIHPIAWKEASAPLACTAFSEVGASLVF